MKHTPEYLALRKIMNEDTGSCEKYVAKVDSIACDAVMNYEFRQDDLQDINEELLAALECVQALDMPRLAGEDLLIDHGFDYENRFDLPATKFVQQRVKAAIAKAKGE